MDENSDYESDYDWDISYDGYETSITAIDKTENSNYDYTTDINVSITLRSSSSNENSYADNVVNSLSIFLGSALTIGEYVSVGAAGATVASTLSIPFAIIGIGLGTYELISALNGTYNNSINDDLEMAFNPIMLTAVVLSTLNGKDKATSIRYGKNASAVSSILNLKDFKISERGVDYLDNAIKAKEFYDGINTLNDDNDNIKSSILP